MEIKLNKWTAGTGFLFIALGIAVLAGLFYSNLAQWRETEARLTHIRSSMGATSSIQAHVLAAQSAVRDYAITGNPASLKDYTKAMADLDREVRFLRQVEKGVVEQAPDLELLLGLLEQRRKIFEESILERRTRGAGTVHLKELTASGSRITAEIDHVVEALQAPERRDMAHLELQSRAASAQRGGLISLTFLLAFLAALGMLGVALSAARRNRLAREELADAHARLNGVLAAANQVAIISTDLNGTITLFNSGAERMLGYKAEEVVGLKTPECIHLKEEVLARGKELTERLGHPVEGFNVFTEALRQGGFENREWTYIRKDGRHFPVELVVTGIKDHAGKLIGFLGLATDIGARKSSQLKMRKLSAAVKSSPTSIVITDKEGRIEYANPKFFELTGYTEKELIGQNPRVIASGKTPVSTYKAMWEAILAGRVWDGELLNRKKNGELFWERASISPVKDPRGNITSFVAVKLDITDQKLAQKETEKARDAAMELARLKSEFLANMSHEIRTPMNAIIGMTDLLLDTPLSEKQRDYVKTVNGAGEALLDIINDILDFSKIESGKLSIERIDFCLRETVESTADLLAPRAQAKNLELAHYIEENLPPLLNGDQGRVRQVLLNLLGNAIKFTETGEVVLRISGVNTGRDNVSLRFEVKDTGIGIPEAARKNLFQGFTQADTSTTRKYGGTGLGLSISKRLVELMSGEIGLESEHGKGSTFWFTLPFGVPAGAPQPEQPAGALAGTRVLIVDDNAANREIVSRYLEVWKMRPATAASGPAALELLRQEAGGGDPFKVALLDMQMPEMDGLMLAARIKADPSISGVRQVMMTSLGRELKPDELEACGISSCLTKPIRPRVLQKNMGLALAPDAAAAPTQAMPVPQAAGPNRRSKFFRVLVAEDNIVNQKVALQQLEKLGYEADVAANGLEVLEALKRRPYDLVLMDCQMPEMDGFQATAEIRRSEGDSRRTPIVAMTANALQGDREKCLAAGMDGYIPKPVHMEKLAEMLALWDTTLDAAVIRDIRELAGPENPGFLADLANTYLGDLQGRLENIRDAVKAGKPEDLRQAAHALKGSSGNVGAKRMQKICLLLEGMGKSGDLQGAAETLAAMEKEAVAARAALAALAAESPGK